MIIMISRYTMSGKRVQITNYAMVRERPYETVQFFLWKTNVTVYLENTNSNVYNIFIFSCIECGRIYFFDERFGLSFTKAN